MTVSITQSLTTTNAQPFCDARYKAIRVLGQCIGQALYGLALLIVAVVCRIFSKRLALMYYSRAHLQFRIGWCRHKAYGLFGNKVINFSCNSCIALPPAKTEETALRNGYGPDTIDQWLRIGTDEIDVDRAALKRLKGKGVCAGMSIDFCSQYFAQVNMGVSPREAIRKISAHYITGAPKAAQLAQIFYIALIRKRSKKRRDINSNDNSNDLIVRNHRSAVMSRIIGKSIQMIVDDLECLEIVRNQFGLGSKSIELYKKLTSSFNEFDIDLFKFLGKLSSGCYQVSMRGARSAHAIVVIKVSNTEYYLFEPNLCAIMCNSTSSITKAISDIAYAIKKEKLVLDFSSIAPS